MSPAPLRVLVVDDHASVRKGLSALLLEQSDMQLVGTAASGEEALAMVADARPDVVIMDVSMPGIDGIETTERLLGANPGARVVMLTSFGGREMRRSALQHGAVGYTLKDAPPGELLNTVRYVARLNSLATRRGAPVVGAREIPNPRPL